jgi:hypothetical protein
MRKSVYGLAFSFCSLLVQAQTDSMSPARFVIGISAPELLHAGLAFNLGMGSQLGASVGIGPTWGGVWPSVNAEHRLYLGKTNQTTKRRTWFLRQGLSYFTAGPDLAATFSFGADLKSKRRDRGWTMDAGMFYLFPGERDRRRNVFPAVRFQYYSYFKKG